MDGTRDPLALDGGTGLAVVALTGRPPAAAYAVGTKQLGLETYGMSPSEGTEPFTGLLANFADSAQLFFKSCRSSFFHTSDLSLPPNSHLGPAGFCPFTL